MRKVYSRGAWGIGRMRHLLKWCVIDAKAQSKVIFGTKIVANIFEFDVMTRNMQSIASKDKWRKSTLNVNLYIFNSNRRHL